MLELKKDMFQSDFDLAIVLEPQIINLRFFHLIQETHILFQVQRGEQGQISGFKDQIDDLAAFVFPQVVIVGDPWKNEQTVIFLDADKLLIDANVATSVRDVNYFDLVIVNVVAKFKTRLVDLNT